MPGEIAVISRYSSATLRRFLCVAALLLCFLQFASAAEPIPPYTARVIDITGTLSASEQAEIDSMLEGLERTKGSQLAVLIVPTSGEETIDQYALRAFEQWKIGRKNIDDGALLVIAKNDRRMRLEVGYGLEGILPDVIAKRVQEEIIVPEFKAGNYFRGISFGVQNYIKVISGEQLPPPPEPRATSDNPDSFFAAIMFLLMFIFPIARSPRSGAGTIAGAVFMGFVVFIVTLYFLSFLVAAAFGLLGFVLTLLSAIYGVRSAGSSGRGYSRGWGGGGFSSGGGGGSSFSGGGGGRSGGGGASSSW